MAKLDAVITRLSAVGADANRLTLLLRSASARTEIVEPRMVLQREDERLHRPRYLLSGWAFRYTQFEDGRRQIFDLVLPGEGLGVCLHRRPLALAGVISLTRVELIDASELVRPEVLDADLKLAGALEIMADFDEARALDQIARLGRMVALERFADLLLQLHDRLAVVGLVENDRFTMPLTQELLADFLGLSTVHVNRTLQELRRLGLVGIDRRGVHIPDRAALARLLPEVPRRSSANRA